MSDWSDDITALAVPLAQASCFTVQETAEALTLLWKHGLTAEEARNLIAAVGPWVGRRETLVANVKVAIETNTRLRAALRPFEAEWMRVRCTHPQRTFGPCIPVEAGGAKRTERPPLGTDVLPPASTVEVANTEGQVELLHGPYQRRFCAAVPRGADLHLLGFCPVCTCRLAGDSVTAPVELDEDTCMSCLVVWVCDELLPELHWEPKQQRTNRLRRA